MAFRTLFRSILLALGLVSLSACGINSVPTAEENAKARWADVQSSYQRRADLIPNRMSGAPGIKLGNVHLMAGVPHITAGMLDALTGTLEGGAPLLTETIGCWTPESEVADILRQVEKAHERCQIGSYPFFREGRVGANFVVRSTSAEELKSCADSLCDGLATAGLDFTPGGI